MSTVHKNKLIELVGEDNIKVMEKIYSKNFHGDTDRDKKDKNFKRKLWGAKIDHDADLDEFKSKFGNLDHIQYDNEKKQLRISDNLVKNLRMLMQDFAKNKQTVETLHEEILGFNTEVMDWNVRGPNIAQTIIDKNADIVMLQEYGTCHEKEYSNTNKLTLRLDLYNRGYNCIFFLNPKYKVTDRTTEDGKEGNAIYYKRDKFRIALNPDKPSDEQTPEELIIEVGTAYPKYDYVRAFDIDETVPKDIIYVKDRNNEDYTISDSSSGEEKIVKVQFNTQHMVGNKRSVGFVKLQEISTGKKVLVGTTHLMTDSYDKFGSIKVEELKLIKNKLLELTIAKILNPQTEGIILGGDFNTKYTDPKKNRAYSDRDIFQSAYGCKFDGTMKIIDDNDNTIITLEDIIKDSPTNIVSSVNGTRKEWIDYIYFSNNTLDKNEIDYEILNLDSVIPDKKHPSDHIPIMSTFKFKEQSGGYYEKYLKYKQKYIKLRNKLNF